MCNAYARSKEAVREQRNICLLSVIVNKKAGYLNVRNIQPCLELSLLINYSP